jgi:Domain of unknown function (DUF4157)/GHH signature containing HNH/Endo VII superfamily nuclease toxin
VQERFDGASRARDARSLNVQLAFVRGVYETRAVGHFLVTPESGPVHARRASETFGAQTPPAMTLTRRPGAARTENGSPVRTETGDGPHREGSNLPSDDTALVAQADSPLELQARYLADRAVGNYGPQHERDKRGLFEVPKNSVVPGPGEPMRESARRRFERRLGFDFSRVRVHTDERAAESAERIGALAYSIDNHVVFGREHRAATEPRRAWVTAHELTHVMQHIRGAESGVLHRQAAPGQQQGPAPPLVTPERSADVSAEEEAQFDDDAAASASRSETWQQIKAGAAGVLYGSTQSLTPGGFAAPSPAPENRTFEFFRGAGQVATGVAEIFTGAAGEVGGGALDVTGVGAPAGVALNIGSAAVIGQGIVSAGAGIRTLVHAAQMAGKPKESWLPKKGTPERNAIEQARKRGIQRKQAQELADIKAGGKGSGVWTDDELATIRETEEFPADVRWHHDPPVALRPELADNPDVVRPVRGGTAGHLAAHGGSWRPQSK